MTALDWIIVAFTVLMAVWGYAQGLIVGALSLAGFAGGAFLGSRLGPLLLEEGSRSPYAPLFALVGALLLGGILASGLELLGFHLRHRIGERFGVLDGIGGAVLVGCLGLGLVWLGGAVALQTPGARELREPIQRSAILSELNARAAAVGPDPAGAGPLRPVPRDRRARGRRARRRTRRSRATRRCARRRAERGPGARARPAGSACRAAAGWRATGSWSRTPTWWPARTTRPCRPAARGTRLDAEAIWFDSRNDLAVLRVPG